MDRLVVVSCRAAQVPASGPWGSSLPERELARQPAHTSYLPQAVPAAIWAGLSGLQVAATPSSCFLCDSRKVDYATLNQTLPILLAKVPLLLEEPEAIEAPVSCQRKRVRRIQRTRLHVGFG